MEQPQALAAAGGKRAGGGGSGGGRAHHKQTPPPAPSCPLCDPRTSKHFHLAYDLKSATPVFKGRFVFEEWRGGAGVAMSGKTIKNMTERGLKKEEN